MSSRVRPKELSPVLPRCPAPSSAGRIFHTADFSNPPFARATFNATMNPDRVLERIGAESRMDAAEAAWRQLSVEATNIIDVLRRHATRDPVAPL
jgi:hypothetical protein